MTSITEQKCLIRAFFLLCLALSFSPAAFCQSSDDCLMCHSDHALSMKKGGQTVSLYADGASLKNSVHGMFGCVDCHRGLTAGDIPHAKVIKPVDCRSCHKDQAARFDKSSHGALVECSACHGTHEMQSVKDPKSIVSRTRVSGMCGKCHEEELRQFSGSAHSSVLIAKESRSPNCVGCHGAHDTKVRDH